MTRIELRIALDLHTACEPEVRVFLDLDPHQGLNSEVELPLVRSGGTVWRGVFHVDERLCDSFAYRIGLVAHLEADWAMRFRNLTLGRDLLADSDQLMVAKCWLIGTCNVQRRVAGGEETRREPGRHLVLLPGGATKRVDPAGNARMRARG